MVRRRTIHYMSDPSSTLSFSPRRQRAGRPPDRVSSDTTLIPDALDHVRFTLEAHMEAVGNRPLGLFAMRVRDPRPWKVTRPNGVVEVE
jgi:hypothetical protein